MLSVIEGLFSGQYLVQINNNYWIVHQVRANFTEVTVTHVVIQFNLNFMWSTSTFYVKYCSDAYYGEAPKVWS